MAISRQPKRSVHNGRNDSLEGFAQIHVNGPVVNTVPQFLKVSLLSRRRELRQFSASRPNMTEAHRSAKVTALKSITT